MDIKDRNSDPEYYASAQWDEEWYDEAEADEQFFIEREES